MVFGSLGDALEISGEFGTMTRFHKRLTATWVALDIWIFLDLFGSTASETSRGTGNNASVFGEKR
jgi:hypothetical protein